MFLLWEEQKIQPLHPEKNDRTATECDWLKEFDVFINRPV